MPSRRVQGPSGADVYGGDTRAMTVRHNAKACRRVNSASSMARALRPSSTQRAGFSASAISTFNEHSSTRWLDNYRCGDCGSVFIGNALTAAELREAYADLDEAAYYRETATASAPKFAAAAADLAALVGKDAAVLDLGGGNGAFARALDARGFTDLPIQEIPGGALPDLPASVRAVYRDEDYATLPPAAFAVVTMMDVLEHVSNIDTTLSAVRRVLRPGGILYVHTPAVTALDRAMHAVQRLPVLGRVGRAWQRARTSIYHLQNFTPRALRLLMARHDFDVVRLERINELSWPIDYYVRVYLVGKAGLPRALCAPMAWLLDAAAAVAAQRQQGGAGGEVARGAMIVVGINAFHADAAAVLLRDGVLVAAVEEERFRRVKHWTGFPAQALAWCLKQGGVSLADVDHVAINQDNGANLGGKLRFMLSQPPSVQAFARSLAQPARPHQPEGTDRAGFSRRRRFAAACIASSIIWRISRRRFMCRRFRRRRFCRSTALAILPARRGARGADTDIRIDGRIDFPHSLGIFYQAMTQYLGFPHYGDEYKVMGLAAYGLTGTYGCDAPDRDDRRRWPLRAEPRLFSSSSRAGCPPGG